MIVVRLPFSSSAGTWWVEEEATEEWTIGLDSILDSG